MENIEYRAVIKFPVKKGLKAMKIHTETVLVQVSGESANSKNTVLTVFEVSTCSYKRRSRSALDAQKPHRH